MAFEQGAGISQLCLEVMLYIASCHLKRSRPLFHKSDFHLLHPSLCFSICSIVLSMLSSLFWSPAQPRYLWESIFDGCCHSTSMPFIPPLPFPECHWAVLLTTGCMTCMDPGRSHVMSRVCVFVWVCAHLKSWTSTKAQFCRISSLISELTTSFSISSSNGTSQQYAILERSQWSDHLLLLLLFFSLYHSI